MGASRQHFEVLGYCRYQISRLGRAHSRDGSRFDATGKREGEVFTFSSQFDAPRFRRRRQWVCRDKPEEFSASLRAFIACGRNSHV